MPIGAQKISSRGVGGSGSYAIVEPTTAQAQRYIDTVPDALQVQSPISIVHRPVAQSNPEEFAAHVPAPARINRRNSSFAAASFMREEDSPAGAYPTVQKPIRRRIKHAVERNRKHSSFSMRDGDTLAGVAREPIRRRSKDAVEHKRTPSQDAKFPSPNPAGVNSSAQEIKINRRKSQKSCEDSKDAVPAYEIPANNYTIPEPRQSLKKNLAPMHLNSINGSERADFGAGRQSLPINNKGRKLFSFKKTELVSSFNFLS